MKYTLRNIGMILLLSSFSFAACQHSVAPEALLSNDPTVRDQAIETLGKMGKRKKASLVEPLAVALHDQDPQIIQRALQALILIGPASVRSLTPALQDQDAYVRACAADGLGQIGTPAAEAVDLLIKSLEDPHPLVQEEARIALQKIAPLR